jgi:hypothetical protein
MFTANVRKSYRGLRVCIKNSWDWGMQTGPSRCSCPQDYGMERFSVCQAWSPQPIQGNKSLALLLPRAGAHLYPCSRKEVKVFPASRPLEIFLAWTSFRKFLWFSSPASRLQLHCVALGL